MLFGLQCEVIIYIFAADKKQNDDNMKKRVVKNVMMLSVALLLAGCDLIDPFNNNNNDSGKHRVITPVVFTVEEEAVADASNDFAFRFFRAVDSTMPKGANYVISPYSAQVALAMALNGAADSTFMQMRDVLGYSGMGIEEINSYNKKLIDGLDFVAEDIRATFANSLWLNSNNFRNPFVEVLPEYKISMLENYDAEVEVLDFSSPAALKYVNRWCSSKTNSLIDKVADELNPYSIVMLINAVYFKAPWNEPFEKKYNFKDYFYSTAGDKQTVEFMNDCFYSSYCKNDNFEIAGKGYGKTHQYSFYVLLPSEGVAPEDCFAEPNTDMWGNLRFETAMVNFYIPKFKVENRTSIIPTLISMGMTEPFDVKADFSNLADADSIHITDATQSNVFMINEKGTEAASTTKVDIGYDGSPTFKKVDFTVNRPFLFFVMENSTKTVLFAGKVSNIEQ